MVNDLFEEQTDLEKIVRKIMQRALTLLQCERCSVLLLEDIDSPVRPPALPHLPKHPFAATFPLNPAGLSCAKSSYILLCCLVMIKCPSHRW